MTGMTIASHISFLSFGTCFCARSVGANGRFLIKAGEINALRCKVELYKAHVYSFVFSEVKCTRPRATLTKPNVQYALAGKGVFDHFFGSVPRLIVRFCESYCMVSYLFFF